MTEHMERIYQAIYNEGAVCGLWYKKLWWSALDYGTVWYSVELRGVAWDIVGEYLALRLCGTPPRDGSVYFYFSVWPIAGRCSGLRWRVGDGL